MINVTGIPTTGMANFDSIIIKLMNKYSVPGAAVAVSQDGAIVVARGCLILPITVLRLLTFSSSFRIASVSKPITAMMVLKLVEQGKLSLDTLVWDLLNGDYPLLPGKSLALDVDKITIKHLLQHSAGWDGLKYDPMFDALNIAAQTGMPSPPDKQAIVRYMWSRPLVNIPGSKYAYANFHYCLLRRVIEHLTGQPYADYVAGNLLGPLGMSAFQGSSLLAGRRNGEARYYPYPREPQQKSVFPPYGLVDSPYGSFDLENMDSHGGWVTSPIDLLSFINGIFLGNFLNPSTFDNIASHRIATPDGQFYGLGWKLAPAAKLDPARDTPEFLRSDFNYYHNGSFPGTTSILVRTKWSGGFNVCWAAVMNIRDRDQNHPINDDLDNTMWTAVRTVVPVVTRINWDRAIVLILFGLIGGGSGVVLPPGGPPVPVDPGVGWQHLTPQMRNVLLGLATAKLAEAVSDPESRRAIQRAAGEAIERSARQIGYD